MWWIWASVVGMGGGGCDVCLASPLAPARDPAAVMRTRASHLFLPFCRTHTRDEKSAWQASPFGRLIYLTH